MKNPVKPKGDIIFHDTTLYRHKAHGDAVTRATIPARYKPSVRRAINTVRANRLLSSDVLVISWQRDVNISSLLLHIALFHAAET